MPIKTPLNKQPATSKHTKASVDELRTKSVISPAALSNEGLPDGWRWVRLGEVCDFIGGGTPSKQEPKYWNGKLNWASVKDVKGNFLNSTEDTITELGLKNSASNVAEPNDLILITRISPGKSIISNIRTAVNQDLKIVKPKFKTSSKFLHYYFQAIEREVIKKSSGTTVLGITLNNLNEIQIPLLDSDTQHAIVSKIEELLSELDKGKQQVETAQQQLRIYRQAVLKWAFEALKEEKTIEEITDEHCIGIVRSSKDQNDNGVGVPYIKMNNLDLNGNVDMKDVVYVKIDEDEKQKYSLKKGDILINTRNSIELVGKTGIVRDEKDIYVFNNNLLRIRTKNEHNPLFIGYQLISPGLRKQMTKEKKSTTNVCALYQRDIFPLRIKITDTINQNFIVQEIENRLSVCDKVEETITTSLQQAETLRQSILKKAFEGKLLTPAAAQPNVYSVNEKNHQ